MPTTQYYVRNRGKITGPFDEAGLMRLKRLGLLAPLHEISSDKKQWSRADQLQGLFNVPLDAPASAMSPASTDAEQAAATTESEKFDEVPLELTNTPAASGATFTCDACGGIFAERDYHFDRGRKICGRCYQQPAIPQPDRPQPAAKSYQGFAITGFVTSLVALVIPYLGLVLAILGVVFSGIALAGMARSKEKSGHGLATAGLIIGIIVLALYLLFIILVVIGVVNNSYAGGM